MNGHTQALPNTAINKTLMLAFYAVIPVVLGIMAADLLLLNGQLKQSMPLTPDAWSWWTVIFGMPHIVASLLTISDREYLVHYRHKLGKPLLLFVLASLLLPQLIGMPAFSIILAVYTIYHLIAQQYGISAMLMKMRPDRYMSAVRWLSVVASVLMYAMSFSTQLFHDRQLAGIAISQWLTVITAFALSGIILLGIHISRQRKTADTAAGQWHLWLNIGMMLACFLCASYEYAALLIIIPRVVHDFSAFAVYSTHDQNRQLVRPDKLVYRLFSFTRLPVIFLCPLLSIVVAFVAFQDKGPVTLFVINVLTLMHYYMEGVIWKKDSLHRHYLRFQ